MTKVNEDDVPHLSFNPNITADKQLGPAPKDEELEKMRQLDPQLDSAWVLWEQIVPKDTKGEWSDATKQVCTIRTVKEFWGCWNHLPQPSTLLEGKKFMRDDGKTTVDIGSFMLFKEGIRPEWEDKANAEGGHLQLNLKPSVGAGCIDQIWNNIVIGAVSGWIEPPERITGMRLVDRLVQKGKPGMIRIEMWYSSDIGEEELYKLRGSFEERMRTRIDGSQLKASWDFTVQVPHSKKQQGGAEEGASKENGRPKK